MPACIHVYVWVFMITFGLSPLLCLLALHDAPGRRDTLASLLFVTLIQGLIYIAQRRCSSEDLTYWEGLLAAAASVTTGQNFMSLLRVFPLLLAIVILSVMYALDHDKRSAVRHAQLRFGKLIVWTYKQRIRT